MIYLAGDKSEGALPIVIAEKVEARDAADVLLDSPQQKVIGSKMSTALTLKAHLTGTTPALRPPGSRQGARTPAVASKGTSGSWPLLV